MRTQPEIDAEIAKLKAALPRLNRSARVDVEAQIFMLSQRGNIERADFHYGDSTAEEYNPDEHQAAIEAAEWIGGKRDKAPSEGI